MSETPRDELWDKLVQAQGQDATEISGAPTKVLRLGEVAMRLGWLTPDRLQAALAEQSQATGTHPHLGEILVQHGWISEEQLGYLLTVRRDQDHDWLLKGRLGRYEIRGLLGEGGMARVYRAHDATLRREVALKVPTVDVGERWTREGQAMARLSHPNIVTVYEVGQEGAVSFLAMEFVAGPSLEKSWADWPLRRKAEALHKIARAIAYAHSLGVVHRDLKPNNVLVGAGDEVKVADFGLARLEGQGTITATGSVMGTPAYMAPEQIRGEATTPATDVYALGGMLYVALTGVLPFAGGDFHALYAHILKNDPTRPTLRDPKAPLELESVCLKALEKEPQRRYADARAFAEELDRWLRGEPVLARPVTMIGRLARRARRNKPLSAAVFAALLAVLGGAAAFGVAWRKNVHERERHERREKALKELNALWAAVEEKNREFRLLRVPADRARQGLQQAVAALDDHIRAWPEEPQGYYVRAKGRLYLGELEKAEEDVRSALAKRPDYSPGWMLLGIVKVEQFERARWIVKFMNGRDDGSGERLLEEARIAFARHADEDPARWGIPATRGDVVLARVGRATYAHYVERNTGRAMDILAEALKEYSAEEFLFWLAVLSKAEEVERLTEAIRMAGGYAEAYLQRGLVRHLRDPSAAVPDYDRALELQPELTATFALRGLAKSMLGRYREAVADFDHALRREPRMAVFYTGRAIARQALKDYSGAFADANRALEIEEGLSGALAVRGLARLKLGDRKGAYTDLDRSLQLDPRPFTLHAERAEMRYDDGDYSGALEDWNQAVAGNGEILEWRLNRAKTYGKLARSKEALEDYEWILKEDPTYSLAYFGRAEIRHEMQEWDGAISDFETGLRLVPEDWEFRPAFRKSMGVSLWNRARQRARNRDAEGALEDLNRAIDVLEPQAVLYTDRATVRMMAEQWPEALCDLDRALQVDPKSWVVLWKRGYVKAKRDDIEGAIADYERALELGPADWDMRPNCERSLRELKERRKNP